MPLLTLLLDKFDDEEENKIIYTDIFQQFTTLIGSRRLLVYCCCNFLNGREYAGAQAGEPHPSKTFDKCGGCTLTFL